MPVEEKPVNARLIGCDEHWVLTFEDSGGPRRMAAADLVRWGTCVEPRRGPLVVLADGSVLVAEPLRIDSKGLTVDSGLFGQVTLRLESLAGLVFRLPADTLHGDRLVDSIVNAPDRSDVVLMRGGDRITGTLTAVSPEKIRIKTDAGPVAINTDRASAVVFNPMLRRQDAPAGLRAWVGLADGSRLVASKLILGRATLRITPAVQPKDSAAAWTTEPEELVFMQPLGGRAVYLSDRRPSGYRHLPYLDLPWSYRTDRNVQGGRLRSDGRLYLKGLGLHSMARLSYPLDGAYRRFDARLAVDDSTQGGGSVRYRVYVDRQKRFESDVVRGSGKPVDVSVDLTGAKRLDLIVDFADRADQLDHANWLDARLVPADKP